jgi:hypothetical protein
MVASSVSTDNLNKFFERVKSIGFIERIFGWSGVVSLSHNAYAEYKLIMDNMARLEQDISGANLKMAEATVSMSGLNSTLESRAAVLAAAEAKEDVYNNTIADQKAEISKLQEAARGAAEQMAGLRSELDVIKAKNSELTAANKTEGEKVAEYKESNFNNLKQVNALTKDVEVWKAKYDEAKAQVTSLTARIAEFDAINKGRLDDYNVKISELTALKRQLDEDRAELQKEREEANAKQLAAMKETWVAHETAVEESIRGICAKHQIEYFGKHQVPFKGLPDNTIKICDEFVIFDAKSPMTDDLNNFPDYIKSQAEAAKKYAKEDGVKKDIFLIVPSNTLECLTSYYYNMADYNVYVVSIDSLLPVILNIKKIEDYEFAEQLSPEERDNICRVIGKLSHAAKRNIQLSEYMCSEFIEVLTNCNGLPTEFVEKIDEYEKSEKLNPPMEKRAKAISDKEIQKCSKSLRQYAAVSGVEAASAEVKEAIENVALFKQE